MPGKGSGHGRPSPWEAKSAVRANRHRVTSLDVAREAGLSQSAVSRTFTPGASVSEKTRERVLAAARRLGYKPNAIARSLITRNTNMIGVVMAQLANPFYHAVLEAISRRLQRLGWRVLLYLAPQGDGIGNALPEILQYQVDGIVIVASTLPAELVAECRQQVTPIVLVNRYMVEADVCAVCCDNVLGGHVVATALQKAGHRRYAYIAGIENTSSRDRERGYLAALGEHGITDVARETGGYTFHGGFAAAERLLRLKDPPDAIFCASDIMAMGALDATRHVVGARVPDEVSIVGFDDIPAATWPSYNLTTVRQPIERMVDAVIEMLVSRIESGEGRAERRFLAGELIVRGTARLAAPLAEQAPPAASAAMGPTIPT